MLENKRVRRISVREERFTESLVLIMTATQRRLDNPSKRQLVSVFVSFYYTVLVLLNKFC